MTATQSGSDALPDVPLLRGLSTRARRALIEEFEPITVPGGTTLIRYGEPADAAYILVSGRLRASLPGGEGEPDVALDEVRPGEVFGELALLSNRPRTATVRAVRDSEVLRLSAARFRRLLVEHPESFLELAAGLVDRVASRLDLPAPVPTALRTIAVVPAGPDVPLGEFCRRLVRALDGATLVRARTVERAVGLDASPGEVTQLLDRIEADNRFVVYQGDGTATDWTRRCLRQADRVLVVGVAGSDPAVGPAERVPSAAHRELVLLHDDGVERPRSTTAWLQARSVVRHHHVRRGRGADYGRVARLLAGEAVGVVLGGGGPRGFAHLGALRALEEAGVPIDAVGGTSIGAVMGAMAAMGWDDAQRVATAMRGFVQTRGLIAPTLPLVAYSSSRRITRLLRDASNFGDTCIEDLWVPFFCVSANLSTTEVVVHDRGPLWWALRASISLPGVLPPVYSDGDLLVDGGVVNDLPVDVMRNRIEGEVVAVDLEPPVDLRVHAPFEPTLSGWKVLGRRLHPLRSRLDVPNAVEILMRAKEVGGRRAMKDSRENAPADLHLRPPADVYGALDFKAGPDLIDLGYRYTRTVVESAPLKLGRG